MELRRIFRPCFNICKLFAYPVLRRRNGLEDVRSVCHHVLDRRTYSSLEREAISLPTEARVVICGGGVLGTSVAYHLAERGWTDVVLLEQGRLTCGTTWHSAGMVGQLRNNTVEMDVTRYSRDLFKRLEEEGHGLGWKECGSINIARTHERMIDFKRKHALASAIGFEVHMLTPHEIKERCPLLNSDDLEGGLWIPSDGVVTAPDVAMAFSKLAKIKGVKIIEGVKVERIQTQNDVVKAVKTSAGKINCEYFVNCAGQWSREVGKLSTPKVRVPLHACEHYYLVTKPVEGVDRMMPVIRDFDGYISTREWNGGILAGGFEPEARPVFHTGVPDKFEFQLLQEDWDHFEILLEQVLHRYPILERAEIRQLVNGPESFTPDSNWILGESAEVYNYYVAAGMNSRGIVGSGGIGKYMAEWIIDGQPSIDLWQYDVRRYVGHHNNRQFLQARTREVVGHQYSLRYPGEEHQSGRKLRTSPLHTRLEVSGACFGETMAYERPMWFDPDKRERGEDVYNHQGCFNKPPWFHIVQAEYMACKERVCLIDMSSFAKFEIKSSGKEAVEYLQYLCSNDVNLETGSIIHTGMQNILGGFENDCSIARLGENYFFMISPATQQTRALSWLHRHLPTDGSVQVRDVTSMFSGINVIGPHAQQLLADVTDVSTNKKDFNVMTCKVIDVGHAGGIRAMRLTHTGEDGFILYIPSEYTLHVYDTLMDAGKDYGIRNAGYYALRHLRIEKSFAYWGLDLNAYTTPLECGREFRVKLDGDDFIGKEALVKQKKEGVGQKFVQFILEKFDVENDVWPWGNEPIFRNGRYVGKTSTCGYGFTLNRMVCLGFIRDYDDNGQPIMNPNIYEYVMDKHAVYEIDVAGRKYLAKPGIHTPKLALSVVDPSLLASLYK
ncbi:pyruvate dehydrogenase phosphatase regulatory subunit, mitochondrial [Patella vulgata]|uniref:pyruvate dehydrogenase phosphatase regulatory subunit, mitochondrial n=1 Tax=Patella vulgata TaxID=6465 RepID=UPI0024A853A7|nr:pyruvate dehydrogenase phosphatase regulatory subunit, mitochondrial [Patella vulgata]